MKKIIIIGLSYVFWVHDPNVIKLPGMPGKSDDKAASAEASESAADSQDVWSHNSRPRSARYFLLKSTYPSPSIKRISCRVG